MSDPNVLSADMVRRAIDMLNEQNRRPPEPHMHLLHPKAYAAGEGRCGECGMYVYVTVDGTKNGERP